MDMTDYDQFMNDACFRWDHLPDKPIVDIDMNQMDSSEFADDRTPGVIDMHYRDQHFVVVPFVLDTEMTVDVALFDSDGRRVRGAVMTTGAPPDPPLEDR